MTETYDLIVVGYGAAGVAASIEAAERGARVLALDAGYGGGATALSGGVVYAGGGTPIQHEAGATDSVDAMYDYLLAEVGDVVSPETVRAFCEGSPELVAWLQAHGVGFKGRLAPYKTSYPIDLYTLYYSGNEQAWPYREIATPAPRGHRQIGAGLGAGKALFDALAASAEKAGVEFRPLSRVTSLIVEDGAVVGVRYSAVSEEDASRFDRGLAYISGKLGNWVPKVGRPLAARLERSRANVATSGEARGRGVLLSAGGFVFNRELLAEHAGGYRDISPLGTVNDDGSAMKLAAVVGGSTAHLDHMAAWRFITPPVAMNKGLAVGPSGRRIANEDLYGAKLAAHMVADHESRGWLVMDADVWAEVKNQTSSQSQPFHLAQLAYLLSTGHEKAPTLDALAAKLGVPAAALNQTVATYNDALRAGRPDPAHKAAAYCQVLDTPPFYAIDISIKNAPLFPAAGITLGGLRVDEATGGVLDADGRVIPGLYAAGRSAVGLCSNGYISGLSIADAFFSGRRAARAVVGN